MSGQFIADFTVPLVLLTDEGRIVVYSFLYLESGRKIVVSNKQSYLNTLLWCFLYQRNTSPKNLSLYSNYVDLKYFFRYLSPMARLGMGNARVNMWTLAKRRKQVRMIGLKTIQKARFWIWSSSCHSPYSYTYSVCIGVNKPVCWRFYHVIIIVLFSRRHTE